MSDGLRERIKQDRPFESTAHAALLNLFVASSYMRHRIEEQCAAFGITFTQYNILRILKGGPADGYARCDVIERMVDTGADVTRLIDRLQRQGFVRRRRSTKDRRVTLHTLTEAGGELLEMMHPGIASVQEHFAERVAPRDLLHLSRICEGIYASDIEAVT